MAVTSSIFRSIGSPPHATRAFDDSVSNTSTYCNFTTSSTGEGQCSTSALTEGIDALIRLKDRGKARFIGVTAYPPEVLIHAMKNAPIDMVLCHNHYNLCDTKLTELIPEATSREVGLVSASPLGTGLLTERGAGAWHPMSGEQRESIVKAAEFCRKSGTSIEKLAIQFSLSNDEIPTTLVSSASSSRIAENARWLGETPDTDLIHTVQRMLEPVRDEDWDFGGWSAGGRILPSI